MKKTIVMPKIEEDVTEVEIGQWLVNVGDDVKAGQPLLEVLVEKANVEVAAEVSGKVVEILQEEGTIVEVGDEIAVIEVEDDVNWRRDA